MSQLFDQPSDRPLDDPVHALDARAGQIHRGLGVVVRWEGMAMVIPSETSHDGVVDQMLEALGPNPSRGSLVKAVNELLATERLKAVALVVEGPDLTLSAMAFGPVEVLVEGSVVLTGGASTVRQELAAGTGRVTLRAAKLAKAAEPVAPYDLRRGVAPGAGLTLANTGVVGSGLGAAAAPPAEAVASALPRASANPSPQSVEPEPVEEAPPISPSPSPPASTSTSNAEEPSGRTASAGTKPPTTPGRVTHLGATSVPLVGPLAQAPDPLPPLPLAADQDSTLDLPVGDDSTEVEGIICARNHFNNPSNATCMVCGLSLAHLSDERVRGPRPTLGFIVFDDGATFGLDRSYVIGREPEPSTQVESEALVLRSDNETLSRTHAELRLEGWRVQLVDRNSTNGTYIWNSLTEEWAQLTAEAPVELHSGATVALGRRTFVFEGVGG